MITCFIVGVNVAYGQRTIAKTDKETFNINNEYNFTITKIDNKTNKILFDVKLDIPSKERKEYYYPTLNKIFTILVDDEIQIIYDVWNKKEELKECYVKTLNIKSAMLSDGKLLSSVAAKAAISNGNTIYRVIYSPDKSKFALLLDNYSKGFIVEPSITIYDSKKVTTLVTKKLKSMYNGTKIQIDPYNNFKIDNAGNLSLIFSTMNEKTNLAIKSYQGDIPFTENDIKNITEKTSDEVTNSGVNKLEQGRFYKSIEDFQNNKPIEGYKIKNGSLDNKSISVVDDMGNIKKLKEESYPSTLMSYRTDQYSAFQLLKLFDGKSYAVLASGKLCFYALYSDNNFLFYSEGINGELKKYKEKFLEEYLEKYNLLDDYKKDKPKREFKDNVNDYFNKEIRRIIKYINLISQKM
jgi:hypothetical protein